jgi:hypothetical protein
MFKLMHMHVCLQARRTWMSIIRLRSIDKRYNTSIIPRADQSLESASEKFQEK